MNDIENLIKKYKRELMEFSFQNPPAVKEAMPTMATVAEVDEPQNQTVVENPVPTVEEGIVGDYFPSYNSYDEFLSQNTQKGTLKVQLFAANRTFPVLGGTVTVLVKLNENDSATLFEGLTDINGIIDPITLPAPSSSSTQSPETANIRPFATYTIIATHPQYAMAQFDNVPIFSNIKSIQQIELVPLVNTGELPPGTITIPPEPYVNLRGGISNGNANNS